jgi:DNA-binding transcriptional LysR family regulator
MVFRGRRRGICLAATHESAVHKSEAASHLLAAVPFEDGRHAKPVAVIYRKNRELTPVMTNFIKALKQPGSLGFDVQSSMFDVTCLSVSV